MYCNNCGSEMADGAKFCSNCGTPMTAPAEPTAPTTPEPMHRGIDLAATEEAPRKPIFDEFQWNVEDYPERNLVEKTEDVDFNWNADPAEILEPVRRNAVQQAPVETTSGINVEAAFEAKQESEDLHTSLFGQVTAEPEELSAAERIDKFYTFNKKNEEFQQLLNREYEKIKAGNVIGQEISEAEEAAEKRFESRPVDTSMEAFLEREGIVKPYQPKAFESDVLQRIEAQEAEKEAKRLEEEARLKAIEEARLEAEAKKKAEEEAKAAEEARLAAEAEAKRRAEEEAARLAEIARRKAEEEAKAAEAARIKAEEEARLKAEEEARIKAEEEARAKAEAEARIKAEEEARLKAEADLKAAQEAAKIRAQQEARLAAEAEAKLKAEQERRAMEAAEAQRKLEEKRQRIAEEANHLAAEEEARKVLEQTNRMREEEAAKIRAAVASLRAGSSAAQAAETAKTAGTAAAVSKEVSEAHKATRNQINEMAKARDAYFAEMEEADVKPAIRAAKDDSAAVTGRATMLGDNDLGKTRVVDKKAIMAGLEGATRVSSKTVAAPAPASDEDFFNSLDAAAAAGVAGMVAEEIEEATNDIPAEPKEMDDLLSQFEIINHMDEEAQEAVIQEENTGLNDTVLMPQDEKVTGFAANDFDNYGNEEAADYINKQKQQIQEDVHEEEEEQLSKKELKAREKEAKRLEKEKAKEEKAAAKKAKKNANIVNFEEEADEDFEEEKGGKGRTVLKVILAILIIVLVLEIAGMAIKIFAPDSGAAEFIDTQFNKVLELIMGEEGDCNTDVIEVQAQDTLMKITKS